MNSRGFSTPFIIIMTILAIIILGPVLLVSIHNASVSNKKAQIKNQIENLHIPVTPQSDQCGGDGVDSNPWCDYKYATTPNTIQNALVSAGYHVINTVSYGGNSKITYKSNDSKLSFDVSTSNGITTLYGEQGQ